MGEVYRARDTRLGRTVAIKVLPAQFASDPQLKRRFEREAKTISSLNHPHICALYDVGDQDGTSFLVMEYVEGQTLADRLHRDGPLPPDDAARYTLRDRGRPGGGTRAGHRPPRSKAGQRHADPLER